MCRLQIQEAITKGAEASMSWCDNAGGQKLWQVRWIRGLSLEPSSSNLVRENFGNGNFSEAWAPRSV